jgi:hypothetical protein
MSGWRLFVELLIPVPLVLTVALLAPLPMCAPPLFAALRAPPLHWPPFRSLF